MSIKKVGIVGAGTMGSAIAEVFAYNGYNVILKDQTIELAERGRENAKRIIEGYEKISNEKVKKEITKIEGYGIKLTEEQKSSITKSLSVNVPVKEVEERIIVTSKNDEMSDCDLIIEAAFEDQAVKNQIFRELSDFSNNAIIASNTSSLSITEMSKNLKKPENGIIMHFFNPPYLLPLVEVVPSLFTSNETLTAVMDLLHGMKNHRENMVPVLAKEREGFIVNRLLIPFINEASKMLDYGIATEKDIDIAMKKGAGFPMGPFELADMIGIDVVKDVMNVFEKTYGDQYKTSQLIRRMSEAGKLGRKTKEGFYKY
ncbi:3-hydroxybutyryl-coa dehydrogenase [Thermoplasma volcanium GSS1]|uniref:3-hydroxybutyryl-coa dehydrogenase n=1 Tax=Thermoplasma volcanium (strain ATCC 51530 / DSM 4299 / JCM 9571 / NBRC 15438 / GSS1) TaxID=273116 RepID=Q979P5_THEVO|nr:3-hydroxyacyl-CoA dehydrogenase family protein [Thermoplasma volcanium]BAB60257.1 3-hydroxybutyryl-coa dehydrogenase [Thermoplasma volcanium GSS1]